MKNLFLLTAAVAALAACTTVANPGAAQQCHDKLGLRYNTAEYDDCVSKFKTQEKEIQSSKHI